MRLLIQPRSPLHGFPAASVYKIFEILQPGLRRVRGRRSTIAEPQIDDYREEDRDMLNNFSLCLMYNDHWSVVYYGTTVHEEQPFVCPADLGVLNICRTSHSICDFLIFSFSCKSKQLAIAVAVMSWLDATPNSVHVDWTLTPDSVL